MFKKQYKLFFNKTNFIHKNYLVLEDRQVASDPET